MMTRPFRIGVSSALNAAQTLHARTVLRALTTAINYLPESASVSLLLADDQASGDRAVEIARRFIAEQVDAVIGPFASDCLSATAAIYGNAGIPLVLPAATICLPVAWPNVFRICPNDRIMAEQIAARAHARGFEHVTLESDDSIHCVRLRGEILRSLARRNIEPDGSRDAQAAIYTGRLAASKKWLLGLRHTNRTIPVLLTDDAAADSLIEGIERPGDIEVFGFPLAGQIPEARPWADYHARDYVGAPPIYFLEVLAAMAILIQTARSRRDPRETLLHDTFATPLGAVSFDEGERRSAKCDSWQITDAGLLSPSRGVTPCANAQPSTLSVPLSIRLTAETSLGTF
jgi:Periplasmic binding protein